MNNETGFVVGADVNPFKAAMENLRASARIGAEGVTDEMGAADQSISGLASVAYKVGEALGNAFKAIGGAIKDSMTEAYESTKTGALVASVAIGAAFAAVGLGAIYTAVKLITGSIGFLVGLVTGSSYQNDKIDELKKASAEMENLRTNFNLTREEASAMGLAFMATGTSAAAYTSTAQGVINAARDNAEAMAYLGIKTNRTGDDIADFERIGGEAVAVLEKYRVGSERAAAATSAGLPSYEDLKNALKNNKEEFQKARLEAEKYSLFISNDAARALKEYGEETKQFDDNMQKTWSGFRRAIADAVMPILTDLASFFKDGLPVVVNVTRAAMTVAVTAFHTFVLGIYVVTESVKASIEAAGAAIAGLGRAFAAVLRGDFAGAWEAVKQGGTNATSRVGEAFDSMAARAEKNAERVRLAFLGGQSGEVQTKSQKDGPGNIFKPRPKADAAKPGGAERGDKEVSAMQTYDQVLEYAKLNYEKENTLRQFSKQQELAYWKEILDTYEVGAKDKGAINLKIAKLEVETMRASAKDQKEITQMRAEDWRAETMDYINELQSRAAFDKEQGTTTQAQYLERMAAFNAMRLQAELEFIAQKIEIAKLDPENNLVLLEQLELQKAEIRRQYRALDLQNEQEKTTASMAQFKSLSDSIESAWANSIKGVAMGTQSIAQGLKGMFKGVLDSMISMLAQMAAKWLAQQLLMKVLGKAFGLGEIAKESAKAGAGGVASMAAAPFPLNLGAPAFGASMAALAMSFAPLASASGGFDIPAGLNPMTQLHAEEMVLPAAIANPLRDSLADGGMGGGTTNVTIHAMDSSSFEQFVKANPAAFAAGMKTANRRGF